MQTEVTDTTAPPLMPPLVSVIVPTKNSAAVLPACLRSIQEQIHANIELIVVDNYSTDDTQKIAKSFTQHVYSKGPERCPQRNFGASHANGRYIMFIDSDMELGPRVVEQCAAALERNDQVQGVIIHEQSFGSNFWARAKALERSFYVDVAWIEAARCFRTETFRRLGGYNETLVSGEDWDLSKRAEEQGSLVAIEEFIRHNEGHVSLGKLLKKKYYYAQHAAAYLKQHPETSMIGAQVGPLNRYKLFFSKPGKLFHKPILGLAMLFMKTLEFGAGAGGYFKPQSKSGHA